MMRSKILIAADHGGFNLKEKLKAYIREMDYEIQDIGTYSEEAVDYPLIAQKLAKKVSKEKLRGILICGTGIGMCIASNKIKGIRSALAYDEETARLSREHNDSNILCLGGRTTRIDMAKKIVKIWLTTPASKVTRHKRRIKEIMDSE
jgi:ribose 5-phosphate isomerase B